MALLLNACSGRLGRFCCLDLDDSKATTVAQAIAEIDALLSGAPSRDDCVLAQSIAAAINEAAARCPETRRSPLLQPVPHQDNLQPEDEESSMARQLQ